MKLQQRHKTAITAFASCLIFQANAAASFLDSDFWCRTYGCAVVHDGQNYDIYDNYIFSQQRCCVANGSQLIPYSTNFGSLKLTGTMNTHQGPDSGQSMMMGITQNGTSIGNAVLDDGDGYLDATDQFSGAFSLNSATDVVLSGNGKQYSHSFYITSRRTRLSLRARASVASSTGDFSNTISLGDIKLGTNISRRGQDGGFSYGQRAADNNIMILNGVDDLGDIQAGPTRIIDFGRLSGIRRRNGDLNEQTIRLDFNYTMPDYDFSMGVGALNVDMVFDLYKEP